MLRVNGLRGETKKRQTLAQILLGLNPNQKSRTKQVLYCPLSIMTQTSLGSNFSTDTQLKRKPETLKTSELSPYVLLPLIYVRLNADALVW